MRVVNYVTAASQAGVSKQAIYSMKKINQEQRGKYPFFIFDPVNGKPGVDIEHPQWLDYLQRNHTIRVKSNRKKQQVNDGDRVDKSSGGDNNADTSNELARLVTAMVDTLQARLNIDDESLKEITEEIDLRFEGRF